MKICILYPPFTSGKAYPLLTQNRQFKYTNSKEVKIYPLVMAYLATMLNKDGNDILWLDAINERFSEEETQKHLISFKPEVCIMETKTPLVHKHWKYIDFLKKIIPSIKVILVGDHVSFFPEESIKNSSVDYVISHGDYDFVCRDLIRYLKNRKKFPQGVWRREKNRIIKPQEKFYFYDINEAPEPDRVLTKWYLYGEAYLYHPVAYILSGRGCGGSNKDPKKRDSSSFPGRCTFCIWQYSFWKCGARLRKPSSVAEEILNLVERFKVKEVFDDNESGACWNQLWLEEFYQELKNRRLLGRVRISSNARADSINNDKICQLLKQCGYRLLKVGVESANDKTLKILKKDEDSSIIKNGIKNAKRHGLIVMMTTMVGYPWEDEKDAENTYKFTKELMLYKTHFGDSLQSSIVVPYPGTPLFKEALKNKWFVKGFNPYDYEKYDMSHQILKSKINTEYWCKKMWRIHLNPIFILKSFFSLKNLNDIKLALKGMVSLFGHLRDYKIRDE